jgi:hypothetical protein
LLNLSTKTLIVILTRYQARLKSNWFLENMVSLIPFITFCLDEFKDQNLSASFEGVVLVDKLNEKMSRRQ